jgi:hypothetical protein
MILGSFLIKGYNSWLSFVRPWPFAFLILVVFLGAKRPKLFFQFLIYLWKRPLINVIFLIENFIHENNIGRFV